MKKCPATLLQVPLVIRKFKSSRTKILPLEPTLEVVLEVFSGIRSTESEAPCRMSPSHAQAGFSSPEKNSKFQACCKMIQKLTATS